MSASKPIASLVIALLFALHLHAQDETRPLRAGDPPLASRIAVSDDDGRTVRISGEAGAVFAGAQVAVRNGYTGETVFVSARGDGSFQATLGGTAAMPYQVNAASSFPPAERDRYVVLPGAGTMLHPAQSGAQDFAIGGQLSYGGALWYGRGSMDETAFVAGDAFSLSLEVDLLVPEADFSLDYGIGGQLLLRRLFDADGQPLSAGFAAQDWSSERTETGLPIVGLQSAAVPLAEATARRVFVDDEAGEVRAALRFEAAFPAAIPDGLYGLLLRGQATIADSDPFDWYANRVFSAAEAEQPGTSETLLPLLLRVGDVNEGRLFVTVLGATAVEDSAQLVDGVQHRNPALPVRLPPGEVVPELRLHSWLPELPLRDARLRGDLRSSVQLTLRGADLSLWSPEIEPLLLEDYGAFSLHQAGTARDAFGNEYSFGGTLRYTSAEPLTLHPAVLPGTVFEVGDTFNPQAATWPYAPARLTLRIADSGGLLHECDQEALTECVIRWAAPGEYVIEYEAVFEDWQVQRRFIAFVVQPGAVAQGRRGLAEYDRAPQAWFDTAVYPLDAPDIAPVVNWPYFSGDVAFLPDAPDAGLQAVLAGDVQFLSVVRPGLALRNIVQAHVVPFARLTNDDPLDGRIGAGSEGNRPGDVLFLFGAAQQGHELRGYASLAVVTDDDSARVVPALSAPLFSEGERPVHLFLLPTSAPPGAIRHRGERLSLAGYVAPPLAADVHGEVIMPSGQTQVIMGQANRYGYFYDSAQEVTLQEAGVVRLRLSAQYDGLTSAGALQRPVSGAVLGAADGYMLFVVDDDAPPLETTRDAASVVASGQPFSIVLRVPDGWSDAQGFYTVSTAQRLLEQGELIASSGQTVYQFNWGQLSRRFPNLEARADDASEMDEVRLSFAITGTDANGSPQIRARAFTLRGNTLYTTGE